MEAKQPKIGDIVLYYPGENDGPDLLNNGAKVLPAIVVEAWSPTTVNLKVFTDGHNDVWLTSIVFGTGEYHWSWPDES